ncbi:MAG: hypothetical protein OXK80_03895 [Bdellovibrionales bacterium]|nr:hypothetical protein [Bdellovibrionales bacterium]
MVKQIRVILLYSLILSPLSGYSFDKCERSLSTRKKQFRSYEDAQTYVQQINIRSRAHYNELKKNEELPDDMPALPDQIYANKGWKGWGNFLGTNRVANRNKQFRTFRRAHNYIRRHNIQSITQYQEMKKNGELPDDMPSNPNQTYKDKGWKGWPHFLGRLQMKSFKQARKYVQDEGIIYSTEYQERKKKGELPLDMPYNPDQMYAGKGWKGWKHFLGTQWKSFKQARKYVQDEGIIYSTEYQERKKNGELPPDMPADPETVYKGKGWKGWPHFLGTEGKNIPRNIKKFRSFEQAQEYVQQEGILSGPKYFELSRSGKLPDDMPSSPNETYAGKGWKGWKHFLGTEGKNITRPKKQFRNFEQAQEYAQQHNIRSSRQYRTMKRNGELPDNMPAQPDEIYANKGWKGWKHFLGTLKMLAFRKAQNYALNKVGIKTVEELKEWLKSEDRPPSFPEEPHVFYEEWTNTRDFLTIHDSNKMTYAESKQYIQSLQFKSKKEAIQWLASEEKPEEIPKDPHIFYGRKWEGWDVYLGLNQGVLYDIQKEQINGTDISGSGESHPNNNEERLMEELLEAVGL